MSGQASPCDTCELNTIVPLDRRELCQELASDIVHQWWADNPTYELSEVAYDMVRYERLDDTEREAVYTCMAEHSSGRCENLNP